eukprot:TRINITY_DN6590_c0_g2_i4.p1 TRINITY_DN6590_c0_g2~~TRINITY_DN6590_c0_g2_i4.p1  ORF type:complete len:409 (-),score=111.36 TRINITY_DN6590_c0_g2_i4:102-1178(-)
MDANIIRRLNVTVGTLRTELESALSENAKLREKVAALQLGKEACEGRLLELQEKFAEQQREGSVQTDWSVTPQEDGSVLVTPRSRHASEKLQWDIKSEGERVVATFITKRDSTELEPAATTSPPPPPPTPTSPRLLAPPPHCPSPTLPHPHHSTPPKPVADASLVSPRGRHSPPKPAASSAESPRGRRSPPKPAAAAAAAESPGPHSPSPSPSPTPISPRGSGGSRSSPPAHSPKSFDSDVMSTERARRLDRNMNLFRSVAMLFTKDGVVLAPSGIVSCTDFRQEAPPPPPPLLLPDSAATVYCAGRGRKNVFTPGGIISVPVTVEMTDAQAAAPDFAEPQVNTSPSVLDTLPRIRKR